ncbi:OX-2 membrane glycoprotein-like [Cyprinodon tularosa]|uniref:OX-2 membrane glycoprotein-like n=1 Tax=Cyprinodon tularosa TaxID=77115 RepID=UPI0018E1DFAE|nr:OX-2 membrane glycoprotein-like [Cyprinodon tularosa]
MRPAVIISCFLVNAILQTGQLALIETEETVWAAVGDQASLSCKLTEDKDVLQFTWQKVLLYAEKNLATYTKKYGYSVRVDLAEKMDFQCEDLQSCSMVIRKVMEEDEGCYRCLFITYRTGILIARTCLRLYELHDPVLDVSRSKSPAESVVSCSATGRPAPTVTLTVLQQNLSFSHYNSSSVTHSNGTVTVTTTALLSASSSTQVGCSVSVLSAAPREKIITVPGVTGASDDGWSVKIVALFFGALVALIIIFLYRRINQNRKPSIEKPSEIKMMENPSKWKSPQIIITGPNEPPMQQENNQTGENVLVRRLSHTPPPSPPGGESCLPVAEKDGQFLTPKKNTCGLKTLRSKWETHLQRR